VSGGGTDAAEQVSKIPNGRGEAPPPRLLDVRPAEQFDMCHIPGGRFSICALCIVFADGATPQDVELRTHEFSLPRLESWPLTEFFSLTPAA